MHNVSASVFLHWGLGGGGKDSRSLASMVWRVRGHGPRLGGAPGSTKWVPDFRWGLVEPPVSGCQAASGITCGGKGQSPRQLLHVQD